MKEFKILKVWDSSKVIFDQLAKRGEKKNAEFFDQLVVDKFSSLSTTQEEKGDLEQIISKHCNRVIGFIKTQEGEYLKPLLKTSHVLLEGSAGIDFNKGEKPHREELKDYKERVSIMKKEILNHFQKYKKKRSLLGKETYELEAWDVKDVDRLKNLLDQI